MYDIYKNIEEQNPYKKCKILNVFHDMIADILSKKNFIINKDYYEYIKILIILQLDYK